eukprot:5571130-Pyramimonas_sp.AAC.1
MLYLVQGQDSYFSQACLGAGTLLSIYNTFVSYPGWAFPGWVCQLAHPSAILSLKLLRLLLEFSSAPAEASGRTIEGSNDWHSFSDSRFDK